MRPAASTASAIARPGRAEWCMLAFCTATLSCRPRAGGHLCAVSSWSSRDVRVACDFTRPHSRCQGLWDPAPARERQRRGLTQISIPPGEHPLNLRVAQGHMIETLIEVAGQRPQILLEPI